jgi:calcineurin-like phosphoesterase family protein
MSHNVFFTSDTHFFHEQDFLYKPRGFESYEEMNEAIVERWNSVVKPNDLVYHLGDVVMSHYDVTLLNRLNGTIYLIRGNHDTDNKLSAIYATGKVTNNNAPTSELIKFGKLSLFLCHYPVLTANHDDNHFSRHVINLHGHTHQTKNWLIADNPFIYHVGMDSHNSTPVHIDEVITDIRQRWNQLGRLPIAPTGIYNIYPSE